MSEMYYGEQGDSLRDSGPPSHAFPFWEVPVYLDVLPESGREVLIVGDVERCREFNHRQGDNPYGFLGTCGLVSCEDVLAQFGVEVTEADVVAHAARAGLCEIDGLPSERGGTTEFSQARILTDAGVPAHAEFSKSLSDLREWVVEGRGVIIEVNAGELWNNPDAYDSGRANHAVCLTGIALDPASGQLAGFYVNDSGRAYPGDAGRFVPVDMMQRMWADAGGSAVITDLMRATPLS